MPQFKTLHLAGKQGPAFLPMPKKVRDGRIVEVYMRPAATYTVATGEALSLFLSDHPNLTVREAVESMRQTGMMPDESAALNTWVEAGFGNLVVGDIFTCSLEVKEEQEQHEA